MHRSNRDLRTKINAHISAILRISFDPLDLELVRECHYTTQGPEKPL